MPRIAVPDGPEPITERVYSLRPEYGPPAAAMFEATAYRSVLPPRLLEGVRYRIALINDCLICQSARRPAALADGFTEDMYAKVVDYASSDEFTEAEKLAIEFAELFTENHSRIDDAFFDRLRAHFTDAEIFDLVYYTGHTMAFGRLTHVLGLDDFCELPSRSHNG